MTRMLASVTSVAEATLAVEAGADIIDLKDPSLGALGALDARVARDIVETVGTFATTSATIGDFPAMEAASIVAATEAAAALGVGYVKIGFWGTPGDSACAQALSRLAAHTRLVAVLFADLPQQSGIAEAVSDAGFSGIMYDTARKQGPSLRQVKSETELALFVRRAHSLGLLCGLAGKLRLADIEPLRSLQPDYLGFRGALCQAGTRTGSLDWQALRQVREAVGKPITA